MSISQEPLIMRVLPNIAKSGLGSNSENIISNVQKNVEELHRLPKTTDDLYREYNTLMSSKIFTSISQLVNIFEIFANKNFPGLEFSITGEEDGYAILVQPNGQNSARSLSLLKKWLGTGILSTIETKIKEIRSLYDSKTKIFNETMIPELWNPNTSSLIFIDVNQFKRINDEVSHIAGDAILEQLAHILKDLRKKYPHAIPIRNGGDEFVVIIDGANIGFIEEYIRTVEYAYSQITGTYGVSCGYYCRTDAREILTYKDAFKKSEDYMKINKDTKGRDYRIQSTLKGFSGDELIRFLKPLLSHLTDEERKEFMSKLHTELL